MGERCVCVRYVNVFYTSHPLRSSGCYLRPAGLKIGHQTSDIGHQTSDIRHRTSDIRHRTSDIGHRFSTINHHPSPINPRPSALVLQPPGNICYQQPVFFTLPLYPFIGRVDRYRSVMISNRYPRNYHTVNQQTMDNS